MHKKLITHSKCYYYWRILNINPSDELKDYTLPFKRSDEIHKWLENNNISDDNILANLYKRELSYINIVLGMKNISNKKDCYNRIALMCKRMKKDILSSNKYIGNKEKKYVSALKTPSLVRLRALFKRCRKNFISIRLSNKECSFCLFGKTLFINCKQ